MKKSSLRTGIVAVLCALLLLAGPLTALAKNSSPAVQPAQSWTWVNPWVLEEDKGEAGSADFQAKHHALSAGNSIAASSCPTAGNIQELKALLQDALETRQAGINLLYTGNVSNIKQQLDETYNSLLDADDYLKYNIRSTQYGFTGYEGQLNIYFNTIYQTTLQQENYVDAQVDSILCKIITPGMNEHQKEKAIHDYIVKNLAYDESFSTGSLAHSAYGALFNKKAVCQGYALLAYKMLGEAGLTARCIPGKGRGVNHLWNLVSLDGNWYHLDCTWNDPAPDSPGKTTYNYYNLSDKEIKIDHSWKAADYPACNSSYFHELKSKMEGDPDNQALWQSLLADTDLNLLLPENTAENITELKEKIHQSMLLYEPVLKLRFNSAGKDPNALLNSAFSSAIKGTACKNSSYNYIDYNRGGQSGYYLLEAAFTYHDTPSPVTWTSWKEEKTISPDHPCWTISFSHNLDINSITSQNFFVDTHPQGLTPLQCFMAPQLTKANQVKIYPPFFEQQWSAGTYYLFISPAVKSAGGKTLKQGLRMKFTVQ